MSRGTEIALDRTDMDLPGDDVAPRQEAPAEESSSPPRKSRRLRNVLIGLRRTSFEAR